MSQKKSSSRSFGFLFFILFLAISLWPIINGANIIIWSAILSLLFLILAIVNSKFLIPLNKIWIKFGEILGRIIAPIVMSIVFFIVLTPISFIVRMFGKDLLKIKLSKDKSYWLKKEKNIQTMKKQF